MATIAFVIACLGLAGEPTGPEFVDKAPQGVVVIAGAGEVPAVAVKEFVSAAKADKGHLVVISTAANANPEEWKKLFGNAVASITVLGATDRSEAARKDFSEVIEKSTGAWLAGGTSEELAALYAGTPVAERLASLLGRGGALGGATGGILASTIITGGKENPETRPGLGLLPGIIVDTNFRPGTSEERLAKAAAQNSGYSGLGITDETAFIVRGREVQVLGKGSATWVSVHSGKTQFLTLPRGTRDDLVRLHRIGGNGPPIPRGRPLLDSGALMAVGGGGMGPDLAKRFIQLAGGDGANIVILPTAAPETSPTAQGEQAKKLLSKGGDARFQVLTSAKRQEVESPDYLTALEKANGVWFGGGRQWRFVDAYEGTRFQSALESVLKRGGVIGGSSAGATILGDYLCRGGPLGNTEIMVPGYDRGFAFLKGVGIDQHFSQRKRFGDMERFSKSHPEFIGVGIDEGTALIVTPRGAEALGPGKVHVYKGGKQLSAHASGDRFTLSP